MKRVITIQQRRGMEGVLSHTTRSRRPDCAYCRNARCEGRSFVCELGRAVDAVCDLFRDSRMPLHPNYLRTL
jgi:hypothetical protein